VVLFFAVVVIRLDKEYYHGAGRPGMPGLRAVESKAVAPGWGGGKKGGLQWAG